MATYKITVSTDGQPDDEAGLQKVVSDYNTTVEVPLSVEEYLTLQLSVAVKSYAGQFLTAETNIIAVKFVKADASLRASVKDALAAVSPDPKP